MLCNCLEVPLLIFKRSDNRIDENRLVPDLEQEHLDLHSEKHKHRSQIQVIHASEQDSLF